MSHETNVFPFSIETSVSQKEYEALMYGIVQRKSNPNLILSLSILLVIAGVISACITGINHMSLIQMAAPFMGLVLLIVWFRVRNHFTKSYLKNPQLHHPILYQFTEESINISGHYFNGTIGWELVRRMDMVRGFVLLYTSPKAAQLIRESSLSDTQLTAIKNKIAKK